MTVLRVAVVGCGPRARRSHLPHLKTFEDVEVVALCDPVPAARDSVGNEFGVPRRYSGVDELLDAEKASLDAVFVATPAHVNAQVALACLERGVNTLLEKPPGMSVEETVGLRDAAERSGAKAMVGWNRRFHPIVVRAREMVEERGAIVQIVAEFHKSIARQEERRKLAEIILEKLLFETPIHAIDLVRAVAGSDVVEVHSAVRRAFSKYRDVHGALITFENGCVAQLSANYTTDARLERYEFHGRDISAYLEGVTEGVVLRGGERHVLRDAGAGGNLEQDRYFLDRVKEDRPVSLPAADLNEAVKTMELAEAIFAGEPRGASDV